MADERGREQEPLDRLEDSIEETRDKVEDAEHPLPLVDDEGQPFAESGTIRRDLVDETIVPPG